MVLFLLRPWYDAVLDWGLNPEPPALEASTIPLGYRGVCTFNKSLSFTEGRNNDATKAASNLGETIIYIYIYIYMSVTLSVLNEV